MPVTIHFASEVDPDLENSNLRVLSFERNLEFELHESVEDSELEEFESAESEPDDILAWELKKI